MLAINVVRRILRSPVAVALIASTATAVLVAGISTASIPDSSGVIHGCYKTAGTSHALKVIDNAVTANCPHGYTSLNWDQTGPQGPPGSSDAYYSNNDFPSEGELPLTWSGSGVEPVNSLSVPAGNYAVNASVTVWSEGEEQMRCFLYSGSTIIDVEATGLTPDAQGVGALSLTGTMANPGTISVSCSGFGDFEQQAGASITATQVVTIN